ncbi:MAG: hypothetical protein Kow0077_32960 [Anaerolineae bacterium]
MDGLEAEYPRISFQRLNALDGGTGQQVFEAAGLRGHPAFLLLMPDGQEVWRSVGQQPAEQMEFALQRVVDG